MSNTSAVIKVADQLISRVFDQRHFTSGEISYLSREIFENGTYNLEKNFDKLLKINEKVCLIADLHNPDSFRDQPNNQDSLIKHTSDEVALLVNKAKNLLKINDDHFRDGEKNLTELRQQLQKRRQDCVRGCESRLEKLRESIVEEELDLERKYLKFEENLRTK